MGILVKKGLIKDAGKSSIIMNFFGEREFLRQTTIGVDFMTKKVERNNAKYYLQLWDTAGQEQYRSLAKVHIKGEIL